MRLPQRTTVALRKRLAADLSIEARLKVKHGQSEDPEVRARIESILGDIDFVRASAVWLVDRGRVIEPSGGMPDYLVLSPDGKHILSSGPDRRLVVTSVEDLKEVGILATLDYETKLLCYRHDGNQVAVSATGWPVTLIDVKTGQKIASLDEKS
jgi:hypothetical protein